MTIPELRRWLDSGPSPDAVAQALADELNSRKPRRGAVRLLRAWEPPVVALPAPEPEKPVAAEHVCPHPCPEPAPAPVPDLSGVRLWSDRFGVHVSGSVAGRDLRADHGFDGITFASEDDARREILRRLA